MERYVKTRRLAMLFLFLLLLALATVTVSADTPDPEWDDNGDIWVVDNNYVLWESENVTGPAIDAGGVIDWEDFMLIWEDNFDYEAVEYTSSSGIETMVSADFSQFVVTTDSSACETSRDKPLIFPRLPA